MASQVWSGCGQVRRCIARRGVRPSMRPKEDQRLMMIGSEHLRQREIYNQHCLLKPATYQT